MTEQNYLWIVEETMSYLALHLQAYLDKIFNID